MRDLSRGWSEGGTTSDPDNSADGGGAQESYRSVAATGHIVCIDEQYVACNERCEMLAVIGHMTTDKDANNSCCAALVHLRPRSLVRDTRPWWSHVTRPGSLALSHHTTSPPSSNIKHHQARMLPHRARTVWQPAAVRPVCPFLPPSTPLLLVLLHRLPPLHLHSPPLRSCRGATRVWSSMGMGGPHHDGIRARLRASCTVLRARRARRGHHRRWQHRLGRRPVHTAC